MKTFLKLLCRITQLVLFACMAGMTIVMISLVVTRYAFAYSPPWSEEVTRYLMVWMVMLGGAVLTLFDDHITLYMFAERLGRRARLIQGILVRALVGTVSAITAWTGFGFAFSMWSVIAPGTQWPMTVPTIAIPVAMTLISAFSILLILRDGMRLAGYEPDWLPAQGDYMYGSFRPIDHREG